MQPSPLNIDAETEKIVREIGIPPCPKIVLEFMQEMRKDDPDMRRLADLIGSDAGLAAAVLKTANSSLFALKSKVSTVQSAFSVLGMRVTSMLVSTLLLKRSFPVSQSKLIETFWRNSSATAAYGAALAPKFVQLDRHVVYTFGLFRDCGQAVMLVNDPNYQGLFTGEGLNISIIEAESQRYPFNHARIGGVLAKSWFLADAICEAILEHHSYAEPGASPGSKSQAAARLIAVGLLADQIQSLHNGGHPHRDWNAAKGFVKTVLGINDAGLDNVASMVEPSEVALAA